MTLPVVAQTLRGRIQLHPQYITSRTPSRQLAATGNPPPAQCQQQSQGCEDVAACGVQRPVKRAEG